MLAAYDPTAGEGGTLFLTGRDGTLYAVDPATGADIRPPTKVADSTGTSPSPMASSSRMRGRGPSIYNGRWPSAAHSHADHAADGYWRRGLPRLHYWCQAAT